MVDKILKRRKNEENHQLSECFCNKYFSFGDIPKPDVQIAKDWRTGPSFISMGEKVPRAGRGLDRAEGRLLPKPEPWRALTKSYHTICLFGIGWCRGEGNACCVSECLGKGVVSETSSSPGSWSRCMNSRATDSALLVLSYSVSSCSRRPVSPFPSTLLPAPSTFHGSCLWEQELGRPENTGESFITRPQTDFQQERVFPASSSSGV